MSEDQLQLNAQRTLQEFDDAGENPDSDPIELGRKAVDALDEFVSHWSDRAYARAQVGEAAGGDNALKEYADRQIEWATREKERVLRLIGKQ
jgi:hypothetical protein